MMLVENNDKKINRILFWLLAISAVVRGIAAASIEFGNDEVYYWTYALYPDWSHFDHPAMVGWVIQLFSLNLLLDSEFFIRLASIVFMTASTYVVFRLGKEIKNAQTGLYAALLYTASIYAFVITGVFIMPDTPLMLFWLLAAWMAIKYLKVKVPEPVEGPTDSKTVLRQAQQPKFLLLFGLFAGLAMLSKYSGIFLWVGMGLYILLFNRKQLKNPYLYLALLISALCCLPILYWNLQNDFISFRFHGDRVGGHVLNPATFGTELAGELFYNNPVNFVLAIMAIVAAFKGRISMDKGPLRLVLCITLPLIFVFLFFSLTRPTLPHWNAPAYCLLCLLTACMLSTKHEPSEGRFAIPKSIVAALGVVVFTVVFGVIEINTGFIPLDRHTEPEMLGRNDFTLDMYGWEQLETKFAALREQKIAEGVMKEEDGIVGDEWFPLANLDYYVARPLGMKVMGVGYLEKLHKYLWINGERGGFTKGEDFWFITDSRYLKNPNGLYPGGFESIEPIDTITIERCGRPTKNFFVYACKGLVYMQPSVQETLAKKK
jgi:4-amino-4-deoxy-L-arabinose transferase-like glycosyltransferase